MTHDPEARARAMRDLVKMDGWELLEATIRRWNDEARARAWVVATIEQRDALKIEVEAREELLQWVRDAQVVQE